MKFKTSREMREGAALIKDRFYIWRKGHKGHLNWGKTTPSSIRRWIRVARYRQIEYDRLHSVDVPHLRPDLLRWIEKVGPQGVKRLLAEWPQLRGLTDEQRAARGAERQNQRLSKKHPLFAAVGALEEVARVATPETTLEQWRNTWEANRQRQALIPKEEKSPHEAIKAKLYAVEEGELDQMTIKQFTVWGRVFVGQQNQLFTDAGEPTIDRPHCILAREVVLAWSRDEEHLRRMIGGIFYSMAARNVQSQIITHGLGALRLVAVELLGDAVWLEEWVNRGRVRHVELQAEKEAKRQERLVQFQPRAEQLVIPLEVQP